jgi:hypothetical protein
MVATVVAAAAGTTAKQSHVSNQTAGIAGCFFTFGPSVSIQETRFVDQSNVLKGAART